MRVYWMGLLLLAFLTSCATQPSVLMSSPPPAPMSPPPPPPPPPSPPMSSYSGVGAEQAPVKVPSMRVGTESAKQAGSGAEQLARMRAMRQFQQQQASAAVGVATPGPQFADAAGSVDESVIAQDTPETSTQKVDDILSQLRLGKVAFNSPELINISQTVSIHVVLSPDAAESALVNRIEEPGKKVTEGLQISNLMEAHLSGEGFKIVAVTPERQAVSSGITEWYWDITPQKEGKLQLTLNIDALITVNGEVVPKTLRTFRKPIEVEVTASQKASNLISEHGKWAWSTLLLPLYAWLAKRRKKNKEAGEADTKATAP